MSTGADCKSQTAPMRNSVAALYAERERQAFFSAVSHDIRPPLNTIVGCSELLMADGTTEEDRRQYLSTIRSSGMMLARLVDDIFDLSKLKSGTLAIIKEPTDVPALVHRVFEVVRTAYPVKRLAVVEDVAPMPCVSVDRQRIQQVLYNLLSNAFKYTDSGRVTVRTRWRYGGFELTVADTGRGISREDLARILKPFASAADINHCAGAGLGLPICQRLVSLMGGKLRIESELGVGSTFTVDIPSVEVVAETPLDAPRVRRALVVDDMPVNRRILGKMLGECGVEEVVAAENGRRAVDLIAEGGAFDVVFTDLRMPFMDGVGLVGVIRETPGLADLPVFLVTADADVEAVSLCEDAGFTGFLLKPFSRADLCGLLNSTFC